MAGYSFGNGLMLDPGEEMRAGEERGKKSALTQLLGKAYNAPQQERGGLLGMAAAIDPQMAMQAETAFGTRDKTRIEGFVKKASLAAAAWKAGNKPLAQSLYAAVLPDAQAFAPEMPLPGEIDESFVKMAEMLGGQEKDLPSSYQEYQLSLKDPGFMPFLQQKTLMTRPPQVGNINGTPIWIGPEGYREVPAAGQTPSGPQPMGAQPTGPKDEDAIYAKANEMSRAGMPQAQVEAWLNQQLQAEVILPGPQTAQADIYSQPQPPISAPPKVKQAWPFLRPEQRRQVLEQESGLEEKPKPRMLSDAEVAQEGLPKGTKAYRDEHGIVKTTYTPPASVQAGGRPLPAPVVTKLTKQATTYDNTQELLGSFSDKYAGNVATGGAENLLGQIGGEKIGLATPGQADWWQRYDRQKNEVRNALFGSALTPSEQAAFERADIRPNMAPDRIRTNLRMQAKIIADGLARQAKVWKAQGYNTEAIDAATSPMPETGTASQTQQQGKFSGFKVID